MVYLLDTSGPPYVLTTLSVDRATYPIFADSLLDTEELTDISTIKAQMWGWEDRVVPLFFETMDISCFSHLVMETRNERNIRGGTSSY